MTSLPESLTDARFNLSNHADVPFAPLESSDELLALLDVEGWDCSGITHETPSSTDEYDGSRHPISVTDAVIENHSIEWTGEYPVPGIESSVRSRVIVAYSEHTPQSDPRSDSDPKFAPGYELIGYGYRSDEGEPTGYVHGGIYMNLARAVYDAVTMLAHIKDGIIIEDVTPLEQATQSLIDELLDDDLTGDEK